MRMLFAWLDRPLDFMTAQNATAVLAVSVLNWKGHRLSNPFLRAPYQPRGVKGGGESRLPLSMEEGNQKKKDSVAGDMKACLEISIHNEVNICSGSLAVCKTSIRTWISESSKSPSFEMDRSVRWLLPNYFRVIHSMIMTSWLGAILKLQSRRSNSLRNDLNTKRIHPSSNWCSTELSIHPDTSIFSSCADADRWTSSARYSNSSKVITILTSYTAYSTYTAWWWRVLCSEVRHDTLAARGESPI